MSQVQRTEVPVAEEPDGEPNENPSLLGELEADQEQLGGEEPETIEIPEKFQNEDGTVNQDALLKSYLELEKGGTKEPEPEAEAVPELKIPEGADQDAIFNENLERWGNDLLDGGDFKPETRAEMRKAHNISDAYIDEIRDGRMARAQLNAREVHDMVGGSEQFDQMMTWAAKNLGREQATNFLAEVDLAKRNRQDAALKVKIDGMQAQWKSATGRGWAPELTGDDPAGETIKPFKSMAEMQKVQASEEYRSGDEAFQREFNIRLKKSMDQKVPGF
jgi:hypothetical protein